LLKKIERNLLRTRRAPGARCALCAPPAALLGPQARSPYVDLGTPTSKISKTCKLSGTEARIAEKNWKGKYLRQVGFFWPAAVTPPCIPMASAKN
jgi:hypothetical protein